MDLEIKELQTSAPLYAELLCHHCLLEDFFFLQRNVPHKNVYNTHLLQRKITKVQVCWRKTALKRPRKFLPVTCEFMAGHQRYTPVTCPCHCLHPFKQFDGCWELVLRCRKTPVRLQTQSYANAGMETQCCNICYYLSSQTQCEPCLGKNSFQGKITSLDTLSNFISCIPQFYLIMFHTFSDFLNIRMFLLLSVTKQNYFSHKNLRHLLDTENI